MALTMDFHGHIWNSCISGICVPVDIEQKGYELVIHDHDCDLCVTKVGVKIYQIMTRVASAVGVPSTPIVY